MDHHINTRSEQFGVMDKRRTDVATMLTHLTNVRTTPSAHTLDQLQLFVVVFPQERMGQLASFGPA
jgi:hypothetical protein